MPRGVRVRVSHGAPHMNIIKEFFLLIFFTPIMWISDWYGRNYVGDQFDEDDFPEIYGEIKTTPVDPNIPIDEDLYGPPTGSKEWEEWIDRKKI